jgi:pantoate--beta-alanine ligase
MARDGERDVAKLGVAMQQICDAHPLVALQYIAAVDAETLASLGQLDGRPARILIAARVGSTRLIDNIAI